METGEQRVLAGRERLAAARREIDAIDAQLVALLRQRMLAADRVAAAKAEAGLPVFDASREESVLARAAERAGAETADDVRALYRALFDISKARQRRGVAP